MILVTGATGTVGAVVVGQLRATGAEIRVAARSPGRVVDHGAADAVAFDFTDPATWAGALDGVRSMFFVRPPALGNVTRDLLPAVAAARDAGVEHVVFLSLQGAERNRLVPHATVEAWLRASGLQWTFVRASFFCQNLSTTQVSDVRDRDRDRDEIVVPAGRGATAFVDADDVGAVAAAALLDRHRHAQQAWTVTGPRALTYRQVAGILTVELDRPIRYADPSVVRYSGMPVAPSRCRGGWWRSPPRSTPPLAWVWPLA